MQTFNCPEKGFKNESEFTTWYGKQIKERWWFFHKISDYSLWFKPFDAICALNWKVSAIEFKFIKWWSCIPFNLLRGSNPKKPGTQVQSLECFERNGWISEIIVYSQKSNRYITLNYSDENLHSKCTI